MDPKMHSVEFWEFPWIVCLVECERIEGIDCTILSRVVET